MLILLLTMTACSLSPAIKGPSDDSDTADESGDTGEDPRTVDDDGDGIADEDGDCDDARSDVNPTATEVCDGVDNDCDDLTDEDVLVILCADVDGDGFGNPDDTLAGCIGDPGRVEDGSDCDDNDPSINPDADEICDDIDQNCNKTADEGALTTFYEDRDKDGFGWYNDGNDTSVAACTAPDGYVAVAGDCNDAEARSYPGAEEVCDDDNLDEDCDGEANEGLASIYYTDVDGDAYGDPSGAAYKCHPSEATESTAGYVSDNTDCDDNNVATYPGALEVCDAEDNDCDGSVDEDICAL